MVVCEVLTSEVRRGWETRRVRTDERVRERKERRRDERNMPFCTVDVSVESWNSCAFGRHTIPDDKVSWRPMTAIRRSSLLRLRRK